MKAISDISELEGKTIKSSKRLGLGRIFSLIFTDETYVVLGIDNDSYDSGGTVELVPDKEIDLRTKKDIGAISQAEYLALRQREAENLNKLREEAARKRLAALKAKYESN